MVVACRLRASRQFFLGGGQLQNCYQSCLAPHRPPSIHPSIHPSLHPFIHPSIESSIHSLPLIQNQVRVTKAAQTSLPAATSLFRAPPQALPGQGMYIVSPGLPGSTPGVSLQLEMPGGRPPNGFPPGHAGGILIRRQDRLHQLPCNAKEQQLYFKLPLGAPWPLGPWLRLGPATLWRKPISVASAAER